MLTTALLPLLLLSAVGAAPTEPRREGTSVEVGSGEAGAAMDGGFDGHGPWGEAESLEEVDFTEQGEGFAGAALERQWPTEEPEIVEGFERLRTGEDMELIEGKGEPLTPTDFDDGEIILNDDQEFTIPKSEDIIQNEGLDFETEETGSFEFGEGETILSDDQEFTIPKSGDIVLNEELTFGAEENGSLEFGEGETVLSDDQEFTIPKGGETIQNEKLAFEADGEGSIKSEDGEIMLY